MEKSSNGSVSHRLSTANLIVRVAEKIDGHLHKYSVDQEKQSKPYIALSTPNSMEVEVGKPFEIKLAKVKYLHAAKPSEIGDMSLVIQTANGSASGVYKFFAMRAGVTMVRLVLAHESTLAIGFQDVDVTIKNVQDVTILEETSRG